MIKVQCMQVWKCHKESHPSVQLICADNYSKNAASEWRRRVGSKAQTNEAEAKLEQWEMRQKELRGDLWPPWLVSREKTECSKEGSVGWWKWRTGAIWFLGGVDVKSSPLRHLQGNTQGEALGTEYMLHARVPIYTFPGRKVGDESAFHWRMEKNWSHGL